VFGNALLAANVTDRTDGLRCMTRPTVDPKLELEYPKAFAEAFAGPLKEQNKIFRYVHVTGAMVERGRSCNPSMRPSERVLTDSASRPDDISLGKG
jgi:hypothetical protein